MSHEEIDADASVVPVGMTRPGDPIAEISFTRGSGCFVWDVEGKQYIDFLSGYGATNFGHAHPELLAEIGRDSELLAQMVGMKSPDRIELQQQLAKLWPFEGDAKVWLASTGARAVEVALKIAQSARPGKIVFFSPGFHGRSIATSVLTTTERVNFDPISQTVALPFPDCQRCPVGFQKSTCFAECSDIGLEDVESRASEISTIVIEPGMGARGYEFPPNHFFQKVGAMAKNSGILLIADEVQMGLFRRGALFASQVCQISPDLMVLGKSLGGGYVPISAVVGRSGLLDRLPPGIESETFSGGTLGCRLALKSIEILNRTETQSAIQKINGVFQSSLPRLIERLPFDAVFEISGPSMAIELLPHDYERGAALAKLWCRAALSAGLLVHHSGRYRNRIVLIPPFVTTPEIVESALEMLVRSADLL